MGLMFTKHALTDAVPYVLLKMQYLSRVSLGTARPNPLALSPSIPNQKQQRHSARLTLAKVHFLYWKLGGKQIN